MQIDVKMCVYPNPFCVCEKIGLVREMAKTTGNSDFSFYFIDSLVIENYVPEP